MRHQAAKLDIWLTRHRHLRLSSPSLSFRFARKAPDDPLSKQFVAVHPCHLPRIIRERFYFRPPTHPPSLRA